MYLYTLAELQVDNVGHLVGDDDHIRRAEAAVHILGGVHALLHQQDGRLARAACVLDLADHEGHILVHSFQQLVRVKLGGWTLGALLEVFVQQVLGHGVTSRTLGGIDAFAFLELLFQQQRRRAMDAAVCRGGRESCVDVRHYSFRASSRSTA